MPTWALKRKILLLQAEGVLETEEEGTEANAALDDLAEIDPSVILTTEDFRGHLEKQNKGFDFSKNLDTSKSF